MGRLAQKGVSDSAVSMLPAVHAPRVQARGPPTASAAGPRRACPAGGRRRPRMPWVHLLIAHPLSCSCSLCAARMWSVCCLLLEGQI
eukprot:363171-Chlamydomonas_euryale.AAC.7